MRNTCVIIGPGGIGKSPVKHVFNVNDKWDPARMRIEGPRTKESEVGGKKNVKAEKKYADPEIYWKLRCLVKPKSLGILNKSPGEYPDDKKVYCYNHSDKNGKLHGLILLYPVRDEQYQMLVINSPQEDCDEKIQAEIYSPVLNIMMQNDMVKGVLGEFAVKRESEHKISFGVGSYTPSKDFYENILISLDLLAKTLDCVKQK